MEDNVCQMAAILSWPVLTPKTKSKFWQAMMQLTDVYIDSLVQDCSSSSALAMELLQSCAKPSICSAVYRRSPGHQIWSPGHQIRSINGMGDP